LNQPLTFQAPTYIYSNLAVASGFLLIQSSFNSNSTISLPSGTGITVQAGSSVVTFGVISGQGTLTVGGAVVLSGSSTINTVDVLDGGSIQFFSNVIIITFGVSGKASTTSTLSITNLWLSGGVLTGSGIFNVGTLTIGVAKSGNLNSIITSHVVLVGNGNIATPGVYLILGDGGNFDIKQDATLTISSDVTFGVQTGSPVVSLAGTLTISGKLTSDVNILGSGTISIPGYLHQEAGSISVAVFSVGTSGFAIFDAVTLAIGRTVGGGSVNITALPTPATSFGSVTLGTLNIFNGPISFSGAVSIGKLYFGNGQLSVTSITTSTITSFVFNGGSLTGGSNVTLNVGSLVLQSEFPKQFSSIKLNVSNLSLDSGSSSTINAQNAQISVSGC